jgi:hypothetical protein
MKVFTAIFAVLVASVLTAQVPTKGFKKVLPQDTHPSGFSVAIRSEPGSDEMSFNDNIRYTTSGSNMKNTIRLKATSRSMVSKEFGRIATETLADIGLVPIAAKNGKSVAYTGDMSPGIELGSGGWVFAPKDAAAYSRLVGMVKYLGYSQYGDITGTVTQLKVSILANDLRFGSGEAAFMPRIKVTSMGTFKAGNTSIGPTIGSMNQDSSEIENAILAAFRRRCFEHQANAVEGLITTLKGDSGLPDKSKANWSSVLAKWVPIIRDGKPRTHVLVELDQMKVFAPERGATKEVIEELARVRDYICESAITIDLRYL